MVVQLTVSAALSEQIRVLIRYSSGALNLHFRGLYRMRRGWGVKFFSLCATARSTQKRRLGLRESAPHGPPSASGETFYL